MKHLAKARLLGAAVIAGAGLVAVLGSSACGTGFDPVSKIQGVRILATKADKPFPHPGDTVNLTMLVADGRSDKTRPLTVSWIPAVCTNPTSDLYYACFAPKYAGDGGADASLGTGTTSNEGGTADAGTVDGGTQSGPVSTPGALASIISKIPPHTNLTPLLPKGLTYSFQVPSDIVSSHPVVAGAARPYGLAVLFNYACAGHLELIPFDGSGNPLQLPIGCFDSDGTQLKADDGVFGLLRVYSYNDITNANPVIDSFTQDGAPVDVKAGITLDHCTASRRKDCPKIKLTPVVPETSWEVNPDSNDGKGNTQHEEIWVDYYSTIGDLGDDARLLYDVGEGKIQKDEVEFQAPSDPGEGTLWAVVHDNRGGVEWVVVPLHIK
jgi:hypothetical protein